MCYRVHEVLPKKAADALKETPVPNRQPDRAAVFQWRKILTGLVGKLRKSPQPATPLKQA